MKSKSFDKLLNCVADMIAELFYYDRKEDENFTREEAEEDLTPEQIELFLAEVRKHL